MLEDNLYRFLEIYNRSPKFIRGPLGKLYRTFPLFIRYGSVYRYYNNLLKKSAYWSDNEKNQYTLNKLSATLINAYENTNYYKNLFNEIKFNPYTVNSVHDIQNIPFANKDIIRQNKNDLINKRIPRKKLLYTTTGGTSGIPIEVFQTKGVERSREYVFINNMWKRIGYSFNHRIIRLRGTIVDDKDNSTYFKFEPIKNRLLISTFDLYDENIPLYISKIIEFNPHFIHTYPSAIIPLAKYVIEKKISFKKLKGIFCSSEQFYPGQRKLIEKAFKVRVYSWYGHTESTTLAGECEVSENYHIFFEYGITELIDDKGNIITEPGKQGEIVGTSFEMKSFPIIRYKTGDYAEYVVGKCSCGRNYDRITNVKGRWLQEQIITKKKHRISLTALNMHSNIFDNVIQYQFYQKEIGKVDLRIIKNQKYSEQDEKKIINSFNEKLKDFVDFNIQYVSSIKKTEIGKHKFLIQEIP